MSEKNLGVSVTYSITRQLAQYEPEVLSITLTQGVDGDYTPEALMLEAQRICRRNTLRAQLKAAGDNSIQSTKDKE